MTAVNTANAPAPRLSDLLMGMTKLRGSEKLRSLLQYGPEGLTTRKIADAIRTSLREKKLPYAGRSEVVANAMEYLGPGDDATVGGLRLLYRAFIRGVHLQSGPDKVAFSSIAKNPTETSKDFTEISKVFREMFGFDRNEKRDLKEIERYQTQEFEKFVTAALGGIWDIKISKADGDQKGMIKVACEDRNDPWAQFEFFLDQANKQILWGDTLANSVRHGDPLLNQVSELLTTLVRRSVDCASDGNALQKAVLSVDKGFDQSRLESLLIEDVVDRPDGFDLVLKDDMGAREEVARRLAEMLPGGFEGLRKNAAANLGDSWDVAVSMVGGVDLKKKVVDQGKVKVAFMDKNNPEAQFEFILDQANKRILWGDALAKRVPHGDPLLKQVAKLLTTLVRDSVGGDSSDSALQKAVLSVDKSFDRSRLDSLIIEDVIERTDRFEVVLQDDTGAQKEVDRRLAAMFPEDFEGLRDFANAKLNGSWDVGVSKVGGVDPGKVRVVATDWSNTETQFEFILDQTNKRILCGGNFAKWAVKGDPRAKQMTELLTALERSSVKDVKGNNALDRVEFKPGDVDAYALLKKRYGSSCKRGMHELILRMGAQFIIHQKTFEGILSKKDYNRAYKAINKAVEKVRTEGLYGTIVMEANSFADKADFRAPTKEISVALSKPNYRDLLKMASNPTQLEVDKLLDAAEDRELETMVRDVAKQYGGRRVPLGQLLLRMAIDKGADWMISDSRETTRTKPVRLPKVQQAPAAGQHHPNG